MAVTNGKIAPAAPALSPSWELTVSKRYLALVVLCVLLLVGATTLAGFGVESLLNPPSPKPTINRVDILPAGSCQQSIFALHPTCGPDLQLPTE